MNSELVLRPEYSESNRVHWLLIQVIDYSDCLHKHVRMAEWSKAPDSSGSFPPWAFWSPNGGVGSNPTSDRFTFALGTLRPTKFAFRPSNLLPYHLFFRGHFSKPLVFPQFLSHPPPQTPIPCPSSSSSVWPMLTKFLVLLEHTLQSTKVIQLSL